MSTVISSLPVTTSVPATAPEFEVKIKPENLVTDPVIQKPPGSLQQTQHHHHHPISYSYGSVCLLCFRTKTCTSVKSDFEKHRKSRRSCTKYIVLLSRYLRLDTELTKISKRSYFQSAAPEEVDQEAFFKEEVNKFIVCDLCLPLAESFCKTYQEFEVLRMKLEAKIVESAACVEKSEVLVESLKVIRGVKKGAGGVKAPDLTGGVLHNFRKELKTQGSNIIKRKGPKLQLERDSKIDQLVPCKVSKLSKDSSSTATKASNSNDPINNKLSSKSSTAFKIVRKPVGGNAAAPTQINIVRLSKEPSPENDNSNSTNSSDKEDGGDINVINIVQKKPPRSLVRPPAPSVPVIASTPTPTIMVYPNPKLQPTQNSIVPASQPQVWPLQNTSLFQTTMLPSTVNVAQVTTQDAALTNVSSNMMPIHIVPVIKVQHCNINGCTVSFPKTEQGFKNMHIHLSTHKNMMCTKCPEIVENPFELISHELKHEMDNPKRMQGFQCPRCPYLSLTRVEFQEHFLERHLYAKVELLKCSVCKRGYNHQKDQQYWSHLQNCHPDPRSEDVALLPSCMICRASFRKKVNLWKHLRNDHRINCQGGSYQCGNCSDSFFFQNLLELHQEFACEGRQKQGCPCLGCNSMFTKTISLKRHLERVHPDFQLPECPVCKLQFFDIETLRYHVMTHNGEQVKILFPEGNGQGQEAQVIPIESMNNLPLMDMDAMNTPPPTPVYNQFQAQTVQTVVSSIVLPTNTLAAPVPSPCPAPVILSVSAASQLPISSPMVVPSNYSNNLFPVDQLDSSNVLQAEVDIKLLEKFFDESNDSEEPLLEFFANTIPPEVGSDNVPPPDEDPFAWMLTEDFQIN